MATIKEEFETLKAKILAGKESETVHVVYVDQERKHRKAPGPTTRFVFNLGSNELYREVFAEWDRILSQIKNVTMARHIVGEEILDALRKLTTERIAEMIGEDEQAGPPPEKARIPEWLK